MPVPVKSEGAAGDRRSEVDGVETGELASYLREHWPQVRNEILEGRYRPSVGLGWALWLTSPYSILRQYFILELLFKCCSVKLIYISICHSKPQFRTIIFIY